MRGDIRPTGSPLIPSPCAVSDVPWGALAFPAQLGASQSVKLPASFSSRPACVVSESPGPRPPPSLWALRNDLGGGQMGS